MWCEPGISCSSRARWRRIETGNLVGALARPEYLIEIDAVAAVD
jgi:hypothetical protein